MRTVSIRGEKIRIFFLIYRRKRRIFSYQRNRIHAKTINSFIKPETHHIINGLPYFRILPIQIGLFPGKIMQIPRSGMRIILPGTFFKITGAVLWMFFFYRPPMIIFIIRIFPGFPGFLKPRMFTTSMINY